MFHLSLKLIICDLFYDVYLLSVDHDRLKFGTTLRLCNDLAFRLDNRLPLKKKKLDMNRRT